MHYDQHHTTTHTIIHYNKHHTTTHNTHNNALWQASHSNTTHTHISTPTIHMAWLVCMYRNRSVQASDPKPWTAVLLHRHTIGPHTHIHTQNDVCMIVTKADTCIDNMWSHYARITNDWPQCNHRFQWGIHSFVLHFCTILSNVRAYSETLTI